MAKINSSYDKAKNDSSHNRYSVDKFKGRLRQEFQNRIKSVRSSLADTNRNLTEDMELTYQEILKSLTDNVDEHDLIHPDEVSEIMREIHDEYLQEVARLQALNNELYIQEQMKATIENLLTCKICSEENVKDVCDKCGQTYFNDETFTS